MNPKKRPAESSSIAGYFALLIAHFVGLTDPNTIIALAGVIAFLPTAVTWIVTLVRNGKAKNGATPPPPPSGSASG